MKTRTTFSQSGRASTWRELIYSRIVIVSTKVRLLCVGAKRVSYRLRDESILLYYMVRGLTYFKTIVWAAVVFMIILVVVSCVTLLQKQGYFIVLSEMPDGIPIAYQAALFTIMIPIYLLAMQQQRDINSVGARAILGYVQFREVTILLICLTIATTLSANAHMVLHTYVSLLLSTAVVIYALHRVFAILFQTTSLKKITEWMINDTVERHVFELRRQRIARNTQYEQIKKARNVSYLHVSLDDKSEYSTYGIRPSRIGIMTNIDVDKIDTGLQKLDRQHKKRKSVSLKPVHKNPATIELKQANKDQSSFMLELHMLTYSELRSSSIVGELMCAKGVNESDRDAALALVKRCIYVGEPRSSLQWINDWLDDTEEAIYGSISSQNTATLQRALDWYQILLDATDRAMSRHMKNDNYDIKAAEAELHSWGADFLSKEQSRLFDIIDDTLRSAVRKDQTDAAKSLIGFIYKNVLSSHHSDDITSIVRSERWFANALGICLYDQDNISDELRDYIMSRYKEHTDLLFYDAKEKEGHNDTEQKRIARDLLRRRVKDLRHGTLIAAKNKNTFVFEILSKLLKKHIYHAYTSRRVDVLPSDIQRDIDNSIVLIITYLYKKDIAAINPYASFIREAKRKWQFEYATERIIQCFDDNLADTWRVDSIDLVADGHMHSVHNYSDDLRILWVNLAKDHHMNAEMVKRFLPVDLLEKTDFFTGGLSQAEKSPFYSLPGHEDLSDELHSAIDACSRIRIAAEHQKLASLSIDESRVESFREKAETAYMDNAVLHSLVRKSHRSIMKPRGQKGYRQYGINTVFDKEAFVDWHRGYLIDHNADDLGQQSASIEDNIILRQIAKERATYVTPVDITAKLDSIGGSWVAIAVNLDQWDLRHSFPALIEEGRSGDAGDWYIKGVCQKEATKQIYSDNPKEQLIYFVKPATLGKFKYLSNTGGYMEISVTALSHDKKALDTLMTEKPEWLAEKGDEAMQRSYLMTKVILKVMHIFRYEPSGSETIVVCDIAQLDK